MVTRGGRPLKPMWGRDLKRMAALVDSSAPERDERDERDERVANVVRGIVAYSMI